MAVGVSPATASNRTYRSTSKPGWGVAADVPPAASGNRRAPLQDSPLLDELGLRARFATSPVAHLATVRPDGGPHVVPIVFALAGQTIYTAVDHKPKRTQQLQRLANLRHDPRCSVLVDHYDDDWTALWWVRADGSAVVVDRPPAGHPGVVALVGRQHHYGSRRPEGPLVAITVERWTGWSSAARPSGLRSTT